MPLRYICPSTSKASVIFKGKKKGKKEERSLHFCAFFSCYPTASSGLGWCQFVPSACQYVRFLFCFVSFLERRDVCTERGEVCRRRDSVESRRLSAFAFQSLVYIQSLFVTYLVLSIVLFSPFDRCLFINKSIFSWRTFLC